MSPAPIPATYVVRRRRGAAITAERRYPARVIDIRAHQLDIEYVRDDGTIGWCAAKRDDVDSHP